MANVKPILTITEDEYHEMEDNYQGICISCKEIADGCEPDAEKYVCGACQKPTVYGVDIALASWYIDIADSDEEAEYEEDDSEDSGGAGLDDE